MSKKFSAGFTALFALAMLSASALAISTPSVTFIPDKISTNSAFIVIADPHAAANDSVIVTWGLNGPSALEMNRQGSFPKINNRYVCYFSNTDNESTCGPAPFKSPSSVPPRSFSVTAINQQNTTGVAVANISVGDVQMLPTVFTPDGLNISIRWYTELVSSSGLFYKVYYAKNLTDAGYSGIVQYGISGYSIDIPAGSGDYFISLRIDASDGSGKFGGMILHYKTPEGIFAGGGPVSLAVDTASFEVLLNKGQNYQRTGFSMTNLGGLQLGNLSVVIPSSYSSIFSIALANDSIAPNGTIFYTITVAGSQHTMEINTRANVTSNNITIGQIPVRINVSVVNECEGAAPAGCPAAGSGILLSPTTWTGDYLAGSPATFNFTVTNTGNTTLSNLSYTSNLGGSLSVDLPSTIMSNGYATASASLSSSYGGVKSGTITITTTQGSAGIAVLANFHEDISSSLSDLQSQYIDFQSNLTVAQRNALASAFSDIDSDISSAETAQENGNYESANNYYTKAAAGLSALQSAFASGSSTPITPSGGGIDFTTVIIIVVIAAAAVAAFIFIRRRRARGGEDELEEELGEEFGPLPEERQ